MTMTIGSMCSGVGGLDRAVERIFNAEPAWFCEYDDAPARILSARWPDVRNFRDITLCDWSTMTRVGIVCAGYPCQPFSAAGKRKGTDDERHLWPYCLDAINTLRPRWSFFENVAGHLTLGFDTVTSDLAVHGWYVRWFVCRASDIGATHHRKRVFIGVSREPWPVPAGARVIARIDDTGQWVEPDDGLFGGIPFEGRWPRAGAVVDGVAYEVDVDVAQAAALEVLPTPTVGNATGTNERRGGARSDEMLLPGVAVAAARGDLADGALLPTPNAHNSNDGEGFDTWDARRRAQQEKHQNGNGRGMPLAIAVQTLPTPRASRGASGTETLYALGGVRDNTNRPQGEVLLPTPRAMEANQTMGAPAANQHVADGVHLLPTPQASDGVGGKASAQVGGTRPSGAKRSIDLPTVAARALALLPTPEAKLSHAGPDYARADRPGSGGDDLATAVARATRERGTDWGKYAPAITRWEHVLGRPAPAPTEPNSNGKPRLAARFAEWMMGWPDGWVTGETETAWRARLAHRRAGSDARPVGHRGTVRRWFSPITRAEQLKAIGNGVVDLQAEYAIRTIMSWPAATEAVAA